MILRSHISYSELTEFVRDCQWKWKLEYLDNRKSPEFSVHFDFGTSIHASLEPYYRRKEPITLEDAVKVFTRKFKWLVKKHRTLYKDKLQDADIESFLVSGENIIRKFKETPELDGAEIVHNEYPLYEPIGRDDGVSINFKGYVDIVLRTTDKRGKPVIYVCDFKTCSWGWDGETRQDRWKHFQLFLYKHFLCKKFDIDPKQVRVAFILLKRRPPGGSHPVEFFPVSAGPVSVQRALDALNESITEMHERGKDNSFVKNRDSCINKYGRRCPFMGTDLCK